MHNVLIWRNATKNAKQKQKKLKANLDGNTYVIIRSAGQTGQLYGSVSTRDIAATLDENGFKVARNQVSLTNPIKVIGLHDLQLILHPEVDASITVNVARSEDEAERQAAGEDLTARDEQFEHDAVDFDEDDIDLSEVFEEREGDEDDADATEEEAPAEDAAEEEADKA